MGQVDNKLAISNLDDGTTCSPEYDSGCHCNSNCSFEEDEGMHTFGRRKKTSAKWENATFSLVCFMQREASDNGIVSFQITQQGITIICMLNEWEDFVLSLKVN